MLRSNRMMLGLWTLLPLTACGDDGSAGGNGDVRVVLAAEETIGDGLTQGSDVENTRDYDVRYSKYLIAIGRVELGRSQSGDRELDEALHIVDLKQVGEEGIEIARFDELAAGQWNEFGFETPSASDAAEALGAVSTADRDLMVANGWTYWIEGSVERGESEGGPVAFQIQVDVPTRFSDCQHDGEPGLAVVEDGTETATITIHGDHLWFNAFPSGTEGTIERRAGWMLAADQDADGLVTTAELASLDTTRVFTSELGYNLGGNPLGADHPIETALDFVRAQLATQGHFQGEGECSWSF